MTLNADAQFLQTPEEVPGTYGENFSRLQQIKNIYDPTNFIQHSLWPTPEQNEKERANKGKQRENVAASSNDEQTASASVPAPARVISQVQAQAQDNRRTRLPSESTFISENIVHPHSDEVSDMDVNDQKQAKTNMNMEEGLSKTRLEAIRDTPLSGVQEHKDNVPSENMNLEETVKAAASSA
jgi:hypothetical protein